MKTWFGIFVTLTLGTDVHPAPLSQALCDANPSQLISEAVDVYNRESNSDFLFKLFKDDFEFKLGPNCENDVKFTIKETICEKSDNQTIEICPFKTDGLEKRCSASTNVQGPSLSVVCSDITNRTKKEPGGYTEASSSLEEDYSGQQEEETFYQEDTLIIEDRSGETSLEEDYDADSWIIQFFQPKPVTEKNDERHHESAEGQKKFHRGQFLGRILCLECFFEILP